MLSALRVPAGDICGNAAVCVVCEIPSEVEAMTPTGLAGLVVVAGSSLADFDEAIRDVADSSIIGSALSG